MADVENVRAFYERQIAELNQTIQDLRTRLQAAESELAALKGKPYEPVPGPGGVPFNAPQLVPLAPYDSPVHAELLKASMQVRPRPVRCCRRRRERADYGRRTVCARRCRATTRGWRIC
jgi:hypothetical protein